MTLLSQSPTDSHSAVSSRLADLIRRFELKTLALRESTTFKMTSSPIVSTAATNGGSNKPKRLQLRHNRSITSNHHLSNQSIALGTCSSATSAYSSSSSACAIERDSIERSTITHEKPLSAQNTESSLITTISILLPTQTHRVSYSTATQRMVRLLASHTWFSSPSKHRSSLLRTLEKGVFIPVLHFKRHPQGSTNVYRHFTSCDLFAPNYMIEQRSYCQLHCIRFPRIHNTFKYSNAIDCIDSLPIENEPEANEDDDDKLSIHSSLNDVHLNSNLATDSLSVSDRPTSVLSDESEDSGCVSMTSHVDASNEPSLLISNEIASDSNNPKLNESLQQSQSGNKSTGSATHLFADNIEFVQHFRKRAAPIESRQRVYVPIHKYLLRCTSKLLLNVASQHEPLSVACRSLRCHLVVGIPRQSEFERRTFLQNWYELSGARYIALQTTSRFGLRRMMLLQRQSPESKQVASPLIKLALFSHLDCSFDHILHVVYGNVNERNVALLHDFVYNFRSRYNSFTTFLYAAEDT